MPGKSFGNICRQASLEFKIDLHRTQVCLILRRMNIQCSEEEVYIFKKIAEAAGRTGMECYAVGGFVRDKILARETKDIDLVCTGDGILLAEEAAKLFKPLPQVSVFKTFGTAQFRVHTTVGITELEFVGARKESYSAQSRNPDVEQASLEEDRKRRDFTINAMSIKLDEKDFGELIDPFDGTGDIERKLIRTPLPPSQTFIDDPLRMMRAIRFASQLSFEIEGETLQAIKDNASRISIITKERITDELNKILLSKKPSVGFDLLYQTGLLNLIFPQMVELAGAEIVDGYGHKDNFYHTLQVIDNIASKTDDLWLRWAAVLHDIAKPVTKKFEEGHGWTFHGHEALGGRMVPKIFAQLKLPQNEKCKLVRKLVEMHLRPISLTKENITDSAVRRLLFDAGEDIDSLMILCEADITSKNQKKVKKYLENFEVVRKRCAEVEESDHLRNWQPPVSGELIMKTFGLAPSKPVGIIKDAIRNAILDGIINNNYEAAYEYMICKGKELNLQIK